MYSSNKSIILAGSIITTMWAQTSSHANTQQVERVYGWGFAHFNYCIDPINDGRIASMEFGFGHTLILLNDGTLHAYGCSVGSGVDSAACGIPRDLGPAIAIAAGGAHNMALLSNGSVRCWGNDSFGQCQVPKGLQGAAQISAGGNTSFVRKNDGVIVGWGSDDYELLSSTPKQLIASQMDAGEYLAVARRSTDGRIVAWGLGAPVLGANPPAVSAVTAGDEHISAILANGTVRHWGFVTTNWSQSVSATNIAAGIDFTAALRSDGTVVRWGGLNEMAVPTTIGPASALYAGGGQIAVRTMRTACDGCVPEAKFDCNNNGQEDTLDIAQGISRDVNQTRVPDECEFPMVRAASGALPVDLLLIADNSASMQDLPIFCSEVLTPVAQTLRNEFDLEVHWFDLVTTLYSQENQCPELDGLHLIQDTTLVPSCGDVEREVQSREDWGDGAALIADPNFISPDANNDGELDIDWTPRAAITIMVILSDEGAELGSDDSPCDDADYLATVNAASRSKEWGVVHVPVAFPDSTDCNYSLELNAPRLMNLLAEQTGGGVVDAQSLATPESRPTIVADMLSKIRAAIEASPRNAAACPADFNRDGSVTAADLSTVLGAWGAAGGDVNGDGTTNAEDLSLVLDAWGECP